jgi:hypothetical protein
MAIEIRELVIKATVVQEGEGASGAATSSSQADSQKEEIVNECVETVLQILREKHER